MVQNPPKKKVENRSKVELPVHFRLASRSGRSVNVGPFSHKATAAGRVELMSIRGLGVRSPPLTNGERIRSNNRSHANEAPGGRSWVFYPMDLRLSRTSLLDTPTAAA